MKTIQRTDKDTQRQWVHKTFSTYKPEYHITICWKDAAEQLWKSLQTQGWKKTRPLWGATTEP